MTDVPRLQINAKRRCLRPVGEGVRDLTALRMSLTNLLQVFFLCKRSEQAEV